MFFFATLQSLKETLHLLIIDIVQQAIQCMRYEQKEQRHNFENVSYAIVLLRSNHKAVKLEPREYTGNGIKSTRDYTDKCKH